MEAIMDGRWWAWLKKDENDGVQYVGVSPVSPAGNPCPLIGVEPFLILHGYAPGPADFTYIPKAMRAGERFTTRPEPTPKGHLTVLESHTQYGIRQLWLDPARGLSAVRFEIRMGPSHTVRTKLMKDYGLKERNSVIEADQWTVLDGINVPTRVTSRHTSISADGKKETVRHIQELSKIRLKPDFSEPNSLAIETVLPEETRVSVTRLDESAAAGLAEDSYHQRLVTALLPLDDEKFSRGETVDELLTNLRAIDRSQDELARLAAESGREWLLRPLLPALRYSLESLEQQTRKMLGRLHGLAELKGKSVPEVVLQTLDGDDVQLAEFIRGKVALLAFWGYT